MFYVEYQHEYDYIACATSQTHTHNLNKKSQIGSSRDSSVLSFILREQVSWVTLDDLFLASTPYISNKNRKLLFFYVQQSSFAINNEIVMSLRTKAMMQ